MAKRFTQLYKFLVPSWLAEGEGDRILYSLARIKDVLVNRARRGLQARMPRRAGPSALALIAADRKILRGREESDAHYAERLTRWRYPKQHRVRGNAWSMLDQIHEYLGGNGWLYSYDSRANLRIRGLRTDTFELSRDHEEYFYAYSAPYVWGVLDPVVNWARFWVILNVNPGLPWITATPGYGPTLWGGAIGAPGYCVGLAGWTPTDTLNIRKLFRGQQAWKSHGTRAEWLCIRLNSWTLGSPPPAADATWDRWAVIVGGVRTATRDPNFRYISLTPEANNAFTGDPTQWADETQMPDGVNYSGDPTQFLTSLFIFGPTGGNTSNFPTKIQLFDDGDQT